MTLSILAGSLLLLHLLIEVQAGSSGCTITANVLTKSFPIPPTTNTLAGSITLSELCTFTGGADCSGSIYTHTSAVGNTANFIHSSSALSVEYTTAIGSNSVAIECSASTGTPATTSITVDLFCGESSTTVSPSSSFPLSQTFNLRYNVQPSYNLTAMQTSASICPIEETLAAGASNSSTWHAKMSETDSTATVFKVLDAEKYTPQVINFFVVSHADGGSAYNSVGIFTLACDDDSIHIDTTSVTTDQIAPINLVASTFFQIDMIANQVTGCTFDTFKIGTAASDTGSVAGLPATADTTTDATKIRVIPSDITAKSTYSFYIWLGISTYSASRRIGPYSLEVACKFYISTALVQDTSTYAQDAFVPVSSKQTLELLLDATNRPAGLAGYVLDFQGFGSAEVACPPNVESYSLSADGITIGPITQISIMPYAGGTANFQVLVDTSTLATLAPLSFYIIAKDTETRWDEKGASQLVEISIVCGSETLTAPSSPPGIALGLNDGSGLQLGVVANLVTTDKAQCGVTKIEFFTSAALTTPLASGNLILSGMTSPYDVVDTVPVDTSSPFFMTIYVRGTTDGGITTSFEMNVITCGNEAISPADASTVTLVANHTGTAVTMTHSELSDLFSITPTSSHVDCKVNGFAFSNSQNCISPTSLIGVASLSTALSQTTLTVSSLSATTANSFYLCMISKGNIKASRLLEVEVCGLETPSTTQSLLSKSLTQFEGEQTMARSEYASFFTTTSSNCQFFSFTIVEEDGSGGYVPYEGSHFSLDSVSEAININTNTAPSYNKIIIEGTTIPGGSLVYLPLEITLTYNAAHAEKLADSINVPPSFAEPPGEEQFQLDAGRSQFEIHLPAFEDSSSNFCAVYISSPVFGNLFVSNSSEVTTWERTTAASSSSLLALDLASGKLTFQVPDGTEGSFNETISITLIDTLSQASSPYSIKIEVQLPASSEEEDKEESSENEGNGSPGEVIDGPKEEGSSGSASNRPSRPIDDPSFAPLEAQVEGLTVLGILELSVNQPLKDFLVDQITTSNLQIYVEPADDRHLTTEGFDLSSLNLTWQAEAYEKEVLRIKLEFASPYSVSPLVQQDTLVIHFKDPQVMISAESLWPLDKAFVTLRKKIPPQMEATALAVSVEATAGSTKEGMKVGMVVSLAVNVLFQGLMSMMLGMINSLQIIIHMPVFSVVFPANAFMVFGFLIPIVTFDVLETFEDQVDAVLGIFMSTSEDEDEPEVPDQFQTVGFDKWQPIPNLGTLGIVTIVYFLKVIVFCVASLLKSKVSRAGPLAEKLKKQLFFQEALLIFIEGYIDFSIAALLFLTKPGSESGLKAFDWTSFGGISVIVFILIPGSLVWLGFKDTDSLNEEGFKEKWSALYEDLKTEEVSQRLYFLVFVLRRLSLVVSAFALRSHPSLQVVALNLTNLGVLIYQGQVQPIASKERNRIELTNEAMICIATFHLMAFTDFEPSPERKALYGWSMCGLVGFYLIWNIGGIIIKLGMQILKKGQQWNQRREQALKMKLQKEQMKSSFFSYSSLSLESLSSREDDGQQAKDLEVAGVSFDNPHIFLENMESPSAPLQAEAKPTAFSQNKALPSPQFTPQTAKPSAEIAIDNFLSKHSLLSTPQDKRKTQPGDEASRGFPERPPAPIQPLILVEQKMKKMKRKNNPWLKFKSKT